MSDNSKKIAIFFICKVTVLVVIILLAAFFAGKLIMKPSVESTVSSILSDEKVISELSTLSVPYAGIYQEYSDNNKKVLRSIAYSGMVTYGIDFYAIKFENNNDDKTITIYIPPVELLKVFVEPNSLRAIPEGKISELQNRLQNCSEDLKLKFKEDEETKKLAVDSTIDTLRSFFTPIINSVDSNYKLIIKVSNEI